MSTPTTRRRKTALAILPTDAKVDAVPTAHVERPWASKAYHVVLRKGDPVHQLYNRVKYLPTLHPADRQHLLMGMSEYLPIGNQGIAERMFHRAALNCYIQAVLLEGDMLELERGTEKHRAACGQHRAFTESMAKAYRLKGMKAPGAGRQRREPRPVDFTRGASNESERDPGTDSANG